MGRKKTIWKQPEFPHAVGFVRDQGTEEQIVGLGSTLASSRHHCTFRRPVLVLAGTPFVPSVTTDHNGWKEVRRYFIPYLSNGRSTGCSCAATFMMNRRRLLPTWAESVGNPRLNPRTKPIRLVRTTQSSCLLVTQRFLPTASPHMPPGFVGMLTSTSPD